MLTWHMSHLLMPQNKTKETNELIMKFELFKATKWMIIERNE